MIENKEERKRRKIQSAKRQIETKKKRARQRDGELIKKYTNNSNKEKNKNKK